MRERHLRTAYAWSCWRGTGSWVTHHDTSTKTVPSRRVQSNVPSPARTPLKGADGEVQASSFRSIGSGDFTNTGELSERLSHGGRGRTPPPPVHRSPLSQQNGLVVQPPLRRPDGERYGGSVRSVARCSSCVETRTFGSVTPQSHSPSASARLQSSSGRMALDDARIHARASASGRPTSLPTQANAHHGAAPPMSLDGLAPFDPAVAAAGEARGNTISASLGLRDGAAAERTGSAHLGGPRFVNGKGSPARAAAAQRQPSGSAKVRGPSFVSLPVQWCSLDA